MVPLKCEDFENVTVRYRPEKFARPSTLRSYRRWVKAPFGAITVPLDRSETAQRGMDYAIHLARGGGVLHFCSVVDIVGAGSVGAGLMMDLSLLTESLEADAEAVCRDAIEVARKKGIGADGKVIYGAVVPAIGQYANETRSDAMVIGTHARRGLSRIVFGSITESLLRISDIPIVVAHTDDVICSAGPLTVAIDGTERPVEHLRPRSRWRKRGAKASHSST